MTERTAPVARLRSSELAVREAIARVIDPHANWDDGTKDDEQFSHQRAKALEKALPIAGLIEAQAAEIAALLKCVRSAEKDIEQVVDGDGGFVLGKSWRNDGLQSKNDQCVHGRWRYDDCADCGFAILNQAISNIRAALAQHQEPK